MKNNNTDQITVEDFEMLAKEIQGSTLPPVIQKRFLSILENLKENGNEALLVNDLFKGIEGISTYNCFGTFNLFLKKNVPGGYKLESLQKSKHGVHWSKQQIRLVKQQAG